MKVTLTIKLRIITPGEFLLPSTSESFVFPFLSRNVSDTMFNFPTKTVLCIKCYNAITNLSAHKSRNVWDVKDGKQLLCHIFIILSVY